MTHYYGTCQVQQRIVIHMQHQVEEGIVIGARRLLRKGQPVLGHHVGIGYYDMVLPPYFHTNSTTSGPTRFCLGVLLFLLLSLVGGLRATASNPFCVI